MSVLQDLGTSLGTKINGLIALINGKVDNSQVLTDVPANAVFTDTDTDTIYTKPIEEPISYITDLQTNLDTYADRVITNQAIPIGEEGQLLFGTGEGNINDKGWLIVEGNFASNDEELTTATASSASNLDVFNTWGRFSHNDTETQPASATEITSWSYDAGTDTISSTVNSSTYIGFYSLNKYDNYEMDLKLTSNVADNDRMGFVIAFMTDDTGREHTLSAVRNNDTNPMTWAIIYNYYRSDEWIVSDGSTIIPSTVDTWATYPDGTRIKVRREKDLIQAWSTQVDSATFVPESLLEVDLSSDTRLEKFRGSQAYGYSAASQDNSTFSDINFVVFSTDGTKDYVFDMSTDTVYVPDGSGGYEIDTSKSLFTDIGPGRLIQDVTSHKTWFISEDGSIQPIVSGEEPAIALPEQDGFAGKYLRTDGTNATWESTPTTSINQLSYTALGGETTFVVPGGYTPGYAEVYLNGVKLQNGVDVDVSSGTDVVFAEAVLVDDIVDINGYTIFTLSEIGSYNDFETAFDSAIV